VLYPTSESAEACRALLTISHTIDGREIAKQDSELTVKKERMAK